MLRLIGKIIKALIILIIGGAIIEGLVSLVFLLLVLG